MTAKEKLYSRAHDAVTKMVAEGRSLTSARTEVAAKFGLSYNTVINITRDLAPEKQSSPQHINF